LWTLNFASIIKINKNKEYTKQIIEFVLYINFSLTKFVSMCTRIIYGVGEEIAKLDLCVHKSHVHAVHQTVAHSQEPVPDLQTNCLDYE